MFARIVECQSKADRSEQAGDKLKNDVIPINSSRVSSTFLRFPIRQIPKGYCASVSGPREKMPGISSPVTITDMLKPVFSLLQRWRRSR
jgi:hypothetical protein